MSSRPREGMRPHTLGERRRLYFDSGTFRDDLTSRRMVAAAELLSQSATWRGKSAIASRPTSPERSDAVTEFRPLPFGLDYSTTRRAPKGTAPVPSAAMPVVGCVIPRTRRRSRVYPSCTEHTHFL